MEKLIKKHKMIIVLGAVLALGIFLRAYHFSDWLHFELDQSRDAKVVDLAVDQGIGNLPLLGPKAAGSFLRLGPIFYYFEYLSALVFGDTPSGIAAHNLIFSVLAIPMFYLLVRRYFVEKIAFGLMLLFSSSLFLIMYSRFAWNPNSLPFFILLALYAILRTVDADEEKKGNWLVVSAFALGILIQLHFVAFLGIPTVLLIFLLIKRPKIRWTFWLAAFSIILVLYSPPIINDIKTGGENIKEFFKVFAKKSDSGDNTLMEKGIRDLTENSLGYGLIVTGYEKAELPRVRQTGLVPDVVCDRGCRDNLLAGVVSLLFFLSGAILLIWRLKKIFREKDSAKKDFIILIGLWFAVTFMLFVPIAYDFAPRFFLLISGLPFIFLGLIVESLENIFRSKKAFWIAAACGLVIMESVNLAMVEGRFSQLARAGSEDVKVGTDRILKEQSRVTLAQQERIADYIQSFYVKNKFPVYVNSEAFYRRAILYVLDSRGIVEDDFRNTQLSKKIYRNGNYFLVYPSNSNMDARTDKYLESYELVEKKNFGTLTVFRLAPKEEMINAIEQEFGPAKKARSASGVPVRCRWNEIFRECNPDEAEDASESGL